MVLFHQNTTKASVCQIVPLTRKCWPEDGVEKTETSSHTGVLMIVCFVGLRWNKTILF